MLGHLVLFFEVFLGGLLVMVRAEKHRTVDLYGSGGLTYGGLKRFVVFFLRYRTTVHPYIESLAIGGAPIRMFLWGGPSPGP